jgi:hypothetical protein
MTTIAYKDGIMAADTQIVSGSIIQGHARKIDHVNGWLVGGAGVFGCTRPVLEWIKNGHELSKAVVWGNTIKDCGVLLADPDGNCYFVSTSNDYVTQISTPFAAEGSGYEIALAAMALGRDAKRAVKLAIEMDTGSGGRVTWLNHAGTGDLKLP